MFPILHKLAGRFWLAGGFLLGIFWEVLFPVAQTRVVSILGNLKFPLGFGGSCVSGGD